MRALFRAFFLVLLLLATSCFESEREAAIAKGAVKLTKADAAKELSDCTLLGRIPRLNIDFVAYYAPSGTVLGVIRGAMSGRDRGAWRVADDGKVCLRWSQWQDNDETCSEIFRDGDRFRIFEPVAGRMVSIAWRERGNTKKLEVRSDLELQQEKKSLEPVSAEALRRMLPGNTHTGRVPSLKNAERHVLYTADNRAFTTTPSAVLKDHGTYRITDDGKVCVTWSYLQGGHESCERWFKSADDYFVFDAYGVLTLVGQIRGGNPEKLGISPTPK